MPDNGYVYVVPVVDPDFYSIRAINLASGLESLSEGITAYFNTQVDLHPSGNYIYAADNAVSPDDIELYDISTGSIRFSSKSPYNGEYEMCGDVWVAQDGLNLFTKCGNVFTSNPNQINDMQFVTKLNIAARVQDLSQSDSETLVLNAQSSRQTEPDKRNIISIFEYPSMSFVQAIEIPTTLVNGVVYKNYGERIFHNVNGDKIIALVKIDAQANKPDEYSLFVLSR
jgi:hypothetical protein